MTADLVQRVVLERAFHYRLNPQRRADADGVGNADVVDGNALQQQHDALDLVGRHLALIRAAQRARHRRAHLDAGRVRRLHHRAETLDAFLDAAVDVALAEGLGGGGEHHDLVGPRRRRQRQRSVQALHVRRQHRITHPGAPLDGGQHLGVVGHLRHPLRADEAGDLDLAQAGRLQPVHQFDLVRRRHRLLFVLQPVARADFHQGDAVGNHDKCLRLSVCVRRPPLPRGGDGAGRRPRYSK